MQEILLIALLLAIVAYWWDTTRTNEIAMHNCGRICQSAGVQLLDATVSRQRVWLRRHPQGGIQICRLYSFEYSSDNKSRQFGYIVLLGRQVVESKIGPADVGEPASGPESGSTFH
ncbi:MAG: DUF3301 domain-containing protein [Gammaproteobacteria bacterium]|jgi:hypothetical protein